MELISKVSKGSKMDQVYIPKRRVGLDVGSYVHIKPVESAVVDPQLFYYSVGELEGVKVGIIKDIFRKIEAENVIVTGSFLDKGFCFNDIDIIVVGGESYEPLREHLEGRYGKVHLIQIISKELANGYATDPLFRLMLSRCVSKKRLIFKARPEFHYKILDLHLMKSKALIDNFRILTGREKYHQTRNLVAMYLFVRKKTVTRSSVDDYIDANLISVEKLKENMVDGQFLIKYKALYKKTQSFVLKNVSKQK